MERENNQFYHLNQFQIKTMIKLNFLGSSHCSKRHGFPQTLDRHFSQMEDHSKSKYSVGKVSSCPGATWYHQDVLDTFYQVASDQISETGYKGQVNLVILGSNDHREINALPPFCQESAFEKFSFKVENFVEKMLSISKSALILATNVIPSEFANPKMKKIVGNIMR